MEVKTGQKKKREAKRPRALYSIDWLQLFVSIPKGGLPGWEKKISPKADAWGNHREYALVNGKHFIKGYEWQKDVVYRDFTIATIAGVPKDERVRKDGGAIKLSNAVLYVTDWYFILNDLLDTLGWVPINITRVDLACDFNYFMGGLHPETFLRKYVSQNKMSYLRKGSNKFCVYGNKGIGNTIIESIRWGSRNSGVSTYMYNKTKELEDVHDKPWIRNAWEKAELSSTMDVWRVEISISSKGRMLRNMSNGALHTLFVDDLRDELVPEKERKKTPSSAQRMFKAYALRYFQFKRIKPGVKFKKDLPDIELLDVNNPAPYEPCTMYENHDTGRMEKIVFNKLEDMRSYLHDRNSKDKYTYIDALDKVIVLYQNHHKLKRRAHEEYDELRLNLQTKLESVLDIPDKQRILKLTGHARCHKEALESLIEDYTSEFLTTFLLARMENASTPSEARSTHAPNLLGKKHNNLNFSEKVLEMEKRTDQWRPLHKVIVPQWADGPCCPITAEGRFKVDN